MEISGIILAGGQGRRFKGNKLDLKIDGLPMYLSQAFKLSSITEDIILSTTHKNLKIINEDLKNIEKYKELYFPYLKHIPKVKIVEDENFLKEKKAIGPIKGIYAGIKTSKNFFSLVTGMDMPLLSYKILNFLKENADKQHDAVIIKWEKGLEVLCGLYTKKCLEEIFRNINNEVYKISEIFKNLNIKIISNAPVDKLNYFNINTIRDYKKFIMIWDQLPHKNFDAKWKNLFYR